MLPPNDGFEFSIRHLTHILVLCHILILKPRWHQCTDFEIVVWPLGAYLLDNLFAIGIEVVSEGSQESLGEFIS